MKIGVRHSEPHNVTPTRGPLGTPRPPTMPHLRVVPPQPPTPVPPPLGAPPAWARPVSPPLPPLDTAALLHDPSVANAFEGMLTKNTNMHRLFRKVGAAGDGARARFGRLVEHLRLLYQLKLSVQLEHLKQRKRLDQAQLNRWIVSTYKVLGFSILTLIVLALVSYLGSNVFYWFSSSWIEPTVISPTDDKVLQLSSKLAEVTGARDKVAAELADADRIIAMQIEFLDGAHKAIQEELVDRKQELDRLVALNRSFTSTRAEVRNNSRAYTGFSRRRLKAEYGAHLIDRESAVSGAMQLSQIAQGNLSLAEKSVELDKRTSALHRETDALASIISHQPATRHSYEVMHMLQELKRAEVELAKARDNRGVLVKSLARYDVMVKSLADSPYLRAVERKDAIAFVPYDNVSKVKAGAPLYSCSLGLFFCRRVGQVTALLAGEMSFKHPLHNTMLRGQSAQVQLDNPHAAERTVLFSGGRPILF
ncbi:MAG: hypothetical protein JWN44_6603 [Myxococcales bacterium]|nr:hypothetical protein [Myxococcales bacterium]